MAAYDVIVIGGGAAGLSAALVLSRARRRVLVIDSGMPRNAPAEHMHGYLSRDGLPPLALLSAGRDEVARYGGAVLTAAVDDVAASERGFDVQLADGRPLAGRRLLVATGLRDEIPDVPGLRERWGRDVLHCPYCHGWEVRDQRLGVLIDGSAESARYAQIVRQWSDDVVVVAPPGTLTAEQRFGLAARSIDVAEGEPAAIRIEHDRLLGVELADGRFIDRQAVFVPPRFVPNNDLLRALGCEIDRNGWVVADGTGRTSVAGVWVAGNVGNPRAQVITAAGEGSTAAIAINADLVDDDVRIATS